MRASVQLYAQSCTSNHPCSCGPSGAAPKEAAGGGRATAASHSRSLWRTMKRTCSASIAGATTGTKWESKLAESRWRVVPYLASSAEFCVANSRKLGCAGMVSCPLVLPGWPATPPEPSLRYPRLRTSSITRRTASCARLASSSSSHRPSLTASANGPRQNEKESSPESPSWPTKSAIVVLGVMLKRVRGELVRLAQKATAAVLPPAACPSSSTGWACLAPSSSRPASALIASVITRPGSGGTRAARSGRRERSCIR